MTKKKKICFVSLGAYPLFNPEIRATFGGAEVQLYLLSKELAKDPDYEVNFVVGDFGQKSLEIFDGVRVYKNPQLKNKKIRFFPYGKLWFVYLILKIRADIYIQRSASLGTGALLILAHVLGKKFIYMAAHEIDCTGEFERISSSLTARFYRYGLLNSDLVIAQNEEQKNMLLEHYGRESIVLRSGYEILPLDVENTKREFTLWVGRVEDWKQPEIFIELARQNPKEKFVMIAPKSNIQPDYFGEVKSRAGQISNLEFIQFVPFAKMDSYFRRAKAYVLTSRYEGFPNTFIQSAKNGTPIFSLAVNPENFIEDYRCGFFAYGDHKKLFDDLKILVDENLRRELSQNAYCYAKENHDIAMITGRLKALFSRI